MDKGEEQMAVEEILRVCNPQDCKTHEYVVSVFDRLEGIVSKLAESNHSLELSIVKITENMDSVRRLHDRIDNIEIGQETMKAVDARLSKVEVSDEKTKSFMWKLTGGFTALTFLAPIIYKLLGM